MGRWCWGLLRGIAGTRFRIVNIYRPVVSCGATSTYQQQLKMLQEKDCDMCPREMLLFDLHKDMTQWYNEGNTIIIMGDFNENVRDSNLQNYFLEFDMKEIILDRHGHTAPNTYLEGIDPIDVSSHPTL
jgi:hypothetical protein